MPLNYLSPVSLPLPLVVLSPHLRGTSHVWWHHQGFFPPFLGLLWVWRISVIPCRKIMKNLYLVPIHVCKWLAKLLSQSTSEYLRMTSRPMPAIFGLPPSEKSHQSSMDCVMGILTRSCRAWWPEHPKKWKSPGPIFGCPKSWGYP